LVTGSIVDSSALNELYVVQNAFPRPSVNRVRLPFRSYPNDVRIDVLEVVGCRSDSTSPVGS